MTPFLSSSYYLDITHKHFSLHQTMNEFTAETAFLNENIFHYRAVS